jgi:hypothetical protein
VIPVSIFAGLSCACAVAPLMAGFVSVISRSTVVGRLSEMTLSWKMTVYTSRLSRRYPAASPTWSASRVIWS